MSHSASLRAPGAGPAGGAAWHPKVLQFVEHWRALAPGPGLLPGRQHFDPMAVPALLPNIWMVDVLPVAPPPGLAAGPKREYRYRLLGTRLMEVGSLARKGERVDDPRVNTDPAAARAIFDRIAESREPDWFRGRPMLRHANYVAMIERISVPFAADGRTVDLIMSLTLFHWSDGTVR